MKKLLHSSLVFTLVLFMTGTFGCADADSTKESRTLSFDQGWHFIKSDPAGAEDPLFESSICLMTGALKTCPVKSPIR
jgi:hypothetical protein